MSRIAGHITALLTLAVYLTACVGFGLHSCSTDRTTTLVPLLGDVSCEAIHVHHHEAGHYCRGHNDDCDHWCDDCHGEHVHSAECCTTRIIVITDVQNKNRLGHIAAQAVCIVLPWTKSVSTASPSGNVAATAPMLPTDSGSNRLTIALRL